MANESLTGARIGPYRVGNAFVPASGRRHYLVTHAATGQRRAMRGYEIVRLARECGAEGLLVVMPGEPWADEAARD